MSRWEKHLSDDDIRQVREATISAGLCKDEVLDVLLRGIDPGFAASLPSAGLAPDVKLSTHLHAMNRVANLRNGDVPLALWLQGAILLSSHRLEEAVFERALLQVNATPPALPANAVSITEPAAVPPNLTIPEAMIGGFDITLEIKYLRDTLAATASVVKVLVHRHIDGAAQFIEGDAKHFWNGTAWLIGPRLLITSRHVINARLKFPVEEMDATSEDFEIQAANTTILYDYFEKSHDLSSGVTTEAGDASGG